MHHSPRRLGLNEILITQHTATHESRQQPGCARPTLTLVTGAGPLFYCEKGAYIEPHVDLLIRHTDVAQIDIFVLTETTDISAEQAHNQYEPSERRAWDDGVV